jgi:hypothetical protein
MHYNIRYEALNIFLTNVLTLDEVGLYGVIPHTSGMPPSPMGNKAKSIRKRLLTGARAQ